MVSKREFFLSESATITIQTRNKLLNIEKIQKIPNLTVSGLRQETTIRPTCQTSTPCLLSVGRIASSTSLSFRRFLSSVLFPASRIYPISRIYSLSHIPKFPIFSVHASPVTSPLITPPLIEVLNGLYMV